MMHCMGGKINGPGNFGPARPIESLIPRELGLGLGTGLGIGIRIGLGLGLGPHFQGRV